MTAREGVWYSSDHIIAAPQHIIHIMSCEEESNGSTSSCAPDRSEKEDPTCSELSKDIDAVLERMEEMADEAMTPDSKMAALIQTFKKLSKVYHEDPDRVVQTPGLVNYIKELISTFEEYDTCGPSGSEGEAQFLSRVATAIASSHDSPNNGDVNMNIMQEGNVAIVHSLQSTNGKRMNGSRVLVLRYHPDQDRWEVRVEFEKGENATTKALKGANLTLLRRHPLPIGPHRGLANMNDIEQVPPKLCELLLHHQKEGFTPSDIMFMGYGSYMFQRIGEMNFMCFAATQMEQIGAVLGLGNFCLEAGEQGTEAVVFALLEGDEMYVDVLCQTMHWTGEIIKTDWESDYSGRDGFGNDCPPTKLTPDQDSAPYVRTMKEGPVLILECVSKYCFAPALWAALSRSEYYHLLIQRLLRWTAREVKKTRDGLVLGETVRRVLSRMFPIVANSLSQPISEKAAENILQDSATVLVHPSSVTVENLIRLLDQA